MLTIAGLARFIYLCKARVVRAKNSFSTCKNVHAPEGNSAL